MSVRKGVILGYKHHSTAIKFLKHNGSLDVRDLNPSDIEFFHANCMINIINNRVFCTHNMIEALR